MTKVCFETFCRKAGVRPSQVIGWRLVAWPDGVQRRELVVNDGRRFLEMPDGSVVQQPFNSVIKQEVMYG